MRQTRGEYGETSREFGASLISASWISGCLRFCTVNLACFLFELKRVGRAYRWGGWEDRVVGGENRVFIQSKLFCFRMRKTCLRQMGRERGGRKKEECWCKRKGRKVGGLT